MSKMIGHKFYCINCGEEGIPLSRPKSLTHEKFHLKKLWCIHCKKEINHVECANSEEVAEFKELFAAGAFKDLATESIDLYEQEKR